MEDQLIFGAFACVSIAFSGTLSELSEKIASALNIKDLDVEPSEQPPYQDVASAEVLGWELLLAADPLDQNVFVLKLETEHAVNEVFYGRMHDLSPWFARFVGMMCDLEVTPRSPSK